jgi:hypothetical protein
MAMYLNKLCQLLCCVCFFHALPVLCSADETQTPSPTSPCSLKVNVSYFTKYAKAKFEEDPQGGGSRWICYNEKVLVETRPIYSGGYYSFALSNVAEEYLEEGNEYVRINDNLVLLRMVVQENTEPDSDNHYWLIDFREKEPLVVGPMGGGDASREFRVIWNDQNVIVILDDDGYPLGSDGQPRGGHRPKWKKGEYKFVKNGDIKIELDGKQYPILNKDGKYREKMGMLYRAYLYDYKKKQLIEAVIEEQH